MASLEELREIRIAKLEKLTKAGMHPYPTEITRSMSLLEADESFKEGASARLTGRIMAIRGGGALLFVALFDGTHDFQVVLKKDAIDNALMDLFVQTIDIGDFIWCEGSFFVTQKGTKSLLVQDWKIAGKSLLPLPDKYAGLQNQDEIYRKRYLDTLTNSESFERFKIRSRIISAIRAFLDQRDFMEVETPILQNQAGGAMAETFKTFHNDYGMEMVLRISLEIEHKMIMAGGYPRIYEIGKNFRNEGSDPTHIQEFTMIEWYAAFETLEQNMQWTEDLIHHLAEKIVGTTRFTIWDKDGNEQEIDVAGQWPRYRFSDLVLTHANLDIHSASDEEIRAKALEWGMEPKDLATTSIPNLLDFIYKKSARHTLLSPAFVTDYPGDLKPLAQQNDDGTAKVAQLIIAGAEITNQYAELVNPLKQRELLTAQAAAKEQGDKEAMGIDENFLTAMEHGMPPMTGFGMGIDRLVAIFTEQKNLRDVIFFPIVKEKED